MSRNLLVSILVVIVLGAVSGYANKTYERISETPAVRQGNQTFARFGLKTDTSKTSIDLDLVLEGGPGKDGIPAITAPKFTSVSRVSRSIRPETQGIAVTFGKTTRFYPYNILNWHEIVNDVIEGKPLTVTFCPLCGSAIVFEATVNGEVFQFGVSGLLYENNLLMYDTKTDTLWSQVLGEAVVGDFAGTKLDHYPLSVMSFDDFRRRYPAGQVLSDDTGFSRRYDIDPYGNYEETDNLLFPLSVRDARLPLKEVMYIVNVGENSVAFKLDDLTRAGEGTIEAGDKKITAKVSDDRILVTKEGDKENIPGYYAMWFSWAVHHQEDGIVWQQP